MYIVLRLANFSEDILKNYLPRLSVQLEVIAHSDTEDSTPGEESSQPTRDLIFAGLVNDVEDPLVVVHKIDEDAKIRNYGYLIWKLDTFLSE